MKKKHHTISSQRISCAKSAVKTALTPVCETAKLSPVMKAVNKPPGHRLAHLPFDGDLSLKEPTRGQCRRHHLWHTD